MNRRRLVGAVAVVAVLALAGCGGPAPKTEVVCEDCSSGVEETADATNRSIAVEESVTHVYLAESGDARVEARMALSGADVDDLRTNETLLASVRDAITYEESDRYDYQYGYEGGYGYGPSRPAFQREDLAVRMAGSELVVTYRAANLSRRRLGATFSNYFYRADGQEIPRELEPGEPWHIATDRLVVHGPDGTAPIHRPPEATVEGDTLVWQGGETIDTRTYLVFGGGAAGGVHARIVVASEVFLWATPIALFGAVVPTVVLFGLSAVFALRYPGYVTDGWSVRSDPLFWAVLCVSATLVATILAAVFTGSGLLALAVVVLLPGLVGGLWWVVRPDDAAILGGTDGSDGREEATREPAESSAGDPVRPSDDPVQSDEDSVQLGGDPDPPTGESASRAEDTEPTGVVSGIAPGQRTLLAVGGSVAAVLVVTALVAADYRAVYAGWVAVGAGIVPLLALPVLGYTVTVPERSDLRGATVVVTSAAPWLVAFSLAVRGGNEVLTAPFLAFLWGFGAILVGLPLFYGMLWLATRRR